MDQLIIRVSQHPLISLLTLGTVLSVIWLELLRKRHGGRQYCWELPIP